MLAACLTYFRRTKGFSREYLIASRHLTTVSQSRYITKGHESQLHIRYPACPSGKCMGSKARFKRLLSSTLREVRRSERTLISFPVRQSLPLWDAQPLLYGRRSAGIALVFVCLHIHVAIITPLHRSCKKSSCTKPITMHPAAWLRSYFSIRYTYSAIKRGHRSEAWYLTCKSRLSLEQIQLS